MERAPLLSVVVPCFNEEAVIEAAHRRLSDVLSNVPDLEYEIIYVDDGSDDGTLDILKDIHAECDRARILSLSRNFGHQLAVTAGLQHAAGDVIVVIDADLQDPPEVIPQMLQRWRDGADVAYGKRARRDGESAFKLLSASAFYRLIDRVSDISIPLDTGDFRLMDRRVVDAFLMMPERDRFVRGMIAWAGYRQEPVLYDRSPRFAGASRYTFPKMVAFAINGILSFSLLPLRIASFVGFFAAMLSTIGIVYALVARLLTDDWVPGWAFLIIAIFFIGGVQLVVLGIIGEYLGRVYGEVKRRPLYLLKERIGFGERQAVGTDRDDFRSPEAPSRPTATPDATSSGNRTTDVDALEPRSAGASPDTNGPPGPRGFSA